MHKKNIVVTTGESRTADAIVRVMMDRADMKQHVGSLKVMHPPDLDNPELSKVGAEIVNLPKTDLSQCDPDECAEMFKGADVAILIPAAVQNKVEQAQAMMKAVKLAGVKNVVLISSQGCTSGLPRLGEFMKIEQAAKQMMPDANLCVLRAGHYMQNLFIYAKQMKEGKHLGIPTGDGKFAPIDDRDVALCAAKIALSGNKYSIASEHVNQVYTLTGLELASGEEIVRMAKPHLQKVGLSSMEFKSLSKNEWGKYIREAVPDMDPSEMELLSEEFDLVREGKLAEICQDVKRICPQENPTTLDEFFQEYADDVFGKEE